MSPPQRITLQPGQESVWDYPRPPRLERVAEHIRVVFGGVTIADTTRAMRVLETSHPPTYYLPPDDILPEVLIGTARRSVCEWKGRARYFDVVVGTARAPDAAWSYPEPVSAFAAIRDFVAIFPEPMEACYVGEDRVQPQEGNFYGGWITSKIVGPFKGPTGTLHW